MKGRVTVRLKAGVLDVEGKAIAGALEKLGFGGVGAVRVGKVFEVELPDTAPEVAQATLTEMAKGLLANPVMETFVVEVEPS